MSKKFTVNVHYDYVATVEVVADNENEALDLAKDIADDYPTDKLEYCSFNDACVTDVVTKEELEEELESLRIERDGLVIDDKAYTMRYDVVCEEIENIEEFLEEMG